MSHSIYQWINQGLVKPDQQQQALQLAGERPSKANWLSFNEKLILALGMLSLALGVVFFFAFNWNEIPRLYKFLILEVLLLAFFVGYYFKSKSFLLAQVLLMAAVIVLGALLALFGQTYQTGADPWQLFATWALLISPLVLFSRSEVLWIFWALLINVAVSLYLSINHVFFGMMFNSSQWFWVFLMVNSVLLLVVEFLSNPSSQYVVQLKLNNRWAAQALGLVVMYIITMIGVNAIWNESEFRTVNSLLFILVMTVTFLYYRFKAKDLLLLTGWALALIVFVLTFLANTIFHNFDAGGFLLMALALIGMSTFAVKWIKQTHELFQQESES